jgi:hypothetical protein
MHNLILLNVQVTEKKVKKWTPDELDPVFDVLPPVDPRPGGPSI